MNQLLEHISVNPDVCFGKPCIRGTRIWISLLLDFLANRMTTEEILAEYPHLTVEDIHAAIAYGAEMSCERHVEISMSEVAVWNLSLMKMMRQRNHTGTLFHHKHPTHHNSHLKKQQNHDTVRGGCGGSGL